jgi:hypothetical protein
VSFDRHLDLTTRETIIGGPQLPIDDERPACDRAQGIRPISGHHAPLDGSPARVILCDVSGLAATLDTIDALARVHLNAVGVATGSNYRISTAPQGADRVHRLAGHLAALRLDRASANARPFRTSIDRQARGWARNSESRR